jgi:hypothetical protein
LLRRRFVSKIPTQANEAWVGHPDGRRFTLTPGMSYQVADNAEAHRSSTAQGAKLFIVD